jgi:hypothetical protein
MLKSKVEILTKDTLISSLRKSTVKTVFVLDPVSGDNAFVINQINKAMKASTPVTIIIIQ